MGKQRTLFDELDDSPILSADELFWRASQDVFNRSNENRRFERKPIGIHGRELCEYLSMWANTPPDGGVIAIGIEKNGDLSGCQNKTETVNKLEVAGHDCCPDARFEIRHVPIVNIKGNNDFVLLLRVKYRPDRVVRTGSGKAFIRRGQSKHELSADEIRELESDKGQVPLEQDRCDLTYPDDFNRDSIAAWSDKARQVNGWIADTPDEQCLANLKMGKIVDGKFMPNVACALLFANDPRDVVPGCKVHFLRFEGEEEGTGEGYSPVQDRFVHGTIPEIIVELDRILSEQLQTFTRLRKNGKFYTEPEYPKLAWYEAIVNACAHRSYGLRNMDIKVKMFRDRLEIESPGPFPPTVTPQNIYKSQHPRNPNLMEALWYFELVRCNNEGTKRMRATMEAANLPPPIFSQSEDGNYTTVLVKLKNNYRERKVFTNQRAAETIGAAFFAGLSDNERLAVNFVLEQGRIKVSALQRLTGLSWPAAYQLLGGLVDRKIFEHIRKENVERDPGAYFTLASHFLQAGR